MSDATLSGGTVNDGSTTLVTFASGTATYTASVANGVDEVTFAPTTNHASATVRYLKGTDVLTDVDSTDDGHQVTLDVGTNAITVEVTAEDGTTTQTYTVTVTRAGTTPTLSIADAAAEEGNDMTFTWTLSPAAAAEVTATWTASFETGDTAGLDDLDYGALSDATGTLTIAANATTGTFQVPTGDDTDNEADETFTMTLSNVSANATLGTAIAKGTITNDDVPAAPTDFEAGVGDTEVELSWDAPASGTNITGHEFRYKEGAGEYRSWTDIPSSAPEETNEKGYTVTGLTNEVVHTFQLRAVNDAGNSAADEADPVTPTPGICGRTDGVQAAIIYHLGEAGVTRTCAEVNVADLVSFTGALEMPDEGISSLRAGDFAGLTKVQTLDLARNNFTTLPANVFSGMTALSALKLQGGALTALPAGVFSGLPALSFIELPNNDLTSLDADVFDGLTALVTLWLNENDLTALPAGVFSGLTALESIVLRANDLTSLDAQQFSGLTALSALELDDNDLTSLPAGVFDGLTALTRLTLHNNDLTSLDARQFSSLTALTFLTLEGNDLNSLPDGLFTGLTALGTLTLGDNPNTDDDLPLTVTVEKVGTDEVRAKVLAGAPVDVEFTPTLVNVELAASDTKLAVDAGAVDGTAETVTRTAPEAATVDVDLSTQPTLPSNHSGYTFEKAASGLPATILSAAATVTDVSVTSTPVLETDTYGAGERIEVSVTFSEAVNATSDTDFVLSTDWGKQRMPLVSGSGTATLVFGHTVVSTNVDADGVFIGKEEVTLVGDRDGNAQAGAITSVATGEPAFIDHSSASQSDHKVDGSRQGVVAPAAPTNFEAAPDGSEKVTLTWDAPASGADITRHEFRYKTGSGSYPTNFTQIASSAPGETNEASFTVESLTNEVVHTFELRAVNTSGESTAVESDPVTPTPGICDRTQQVQDGIVAEVSGADACNEVTVADLAGIGSLALDRESITSLEEGDFAGLTGLTFLDLQENQLGALPANLFSGLTSLQTLDLFDTGVTSLPADAFSGLTALVAINLGSNSSLGSLPANQFSGLTNLEDLDVGVIGMTTLPAGLFSELSELTTLNLATNALGSLPAGVFSGLSKLDELLLTATGLSALPNGVFSDLTALTSLDLRDNPTSGDTLPLTVTVEKVGEDQVRAKVLAGAPFAVDFTPAVVNGSLPTGVTTLDVAAGEVDGTPVTVTRTEGTTDAVTVDVDLSTQPSRPGLHFGYEFARSSDLPKEILPEEGGDCADGHLGGGDLDAAAGDRHLRGGRDDRGLGDLQRGGRRHFRHGLRAERGWRQARAAGGRLGHGDAGVRLHRGARRRGHQRHLDRGRDPDPGGRPRRESPERRDRERGQRHGGGPRPFGTGHAERPQGGRHAFDPLGGGDLHPAAAERHLRGGRDDPLHGDLQPRGERGRGPGSHVRARQLGPIAERRRGVRVGQRRRRAGLRLHRGARRRGRQRRLPEGRRRLR